MGKAIKTTNIEVIAKPMERGFPARIFQYTRERKHIPQLERGFLLSVKEVKSAV